ncbi:hypothetical protein M422DRAFT_254182 [Sphaerobolus stellatus SS14]|uniref:Unplaced genomic scaffold SPHSTscaffold_53, whole genome shotgun sequence n=1 Tax=Sphaerobolus stellatus (strain SS14) TaxID=990650 RepID=A0A0C9VLS7_SPHS4|nr:hypothetical protein M422DRAFT_254182 [Sphaerobolus stellatus SS14]
MNYHPRILRILDRTTLEQPIPPHSPPSTSGPPICATTSVFAFAFGLRIAFGVGLEDAVEDAVGAGLAVEDTIGHVHGLRLEPEDGVVRILEDALAAVDGLEEAAHNTRHKDNAGDP